MLHKIIESANVNVHEVTNETCENVNSSNNEQKIETSSVIPPPPPTRHAGPASKDEEKRSRHQIVSRSLFH